MPAPAENLDMPPQTPAEAFHKALRKLKEEADEIPDWDYNPHHKRDERIRKWLRTLVPGTNENTQHTPWAPLKFTSARRRN
ncbi:uncharacterized protein LOC62_03G003975 [Vanrija pseudolonga]|uniref:Uncharacterized protein n=1 Tax=Vanrija pseudolonga TaxID=143232 RepID=A0AAF1BGZ7_9TREE|nr:hypothetical protein LOC62_03G003975 [Vanrija pseudolonga]